MILALLTAPLKVTAAEQNGESSDKQQNETTEQKTEETEETAPEMTTDLGLASPSVLLMEAQTGTVLYEKNASEQRSPASITKIMTLLLIFEELEKGTLQLTDEVTTSAHARSMGGSQVFLEEGEKQTVETMIKCIVVASGNDASVAMAEHIAGTESEFVSRMNQKAKELGMNDTKFEDCCGLTDSDGHYTTAADLSTQTIRAVVSTSQQNIRYSNPENNGRSDKPCAMPIVKGFSTAPEKPIWAATYTIHSPVMESYPIDMASGTMMMTKASVSSLIPNTEPKRLKRMMTKDITTLFTPSILISRCFSSPFVKFRNEKMPVSIARLLFII